MSESCKAHKETVWPKFEALNFKASGMYGKRSAKRRNNGKV
jgi:hypothetical protein